MSKATEYAAKFNQVFDYIDKHLDEELALERLSQVACFSKYHFHRQFSEYTGISVFKYVQLVRLKRASYRLVFNQQERIIDIALDARFENPESFSRAFKNTFGQSSAGEVAIHAPKSWSYDPRPLRFKLSEAGTINRSVCSAASGRVDESSIASPVPTAPSRSELM